MSSITLFFEGDYLWWQWCITIGRLLDNVWCAGDPKRIKDSRFSRYVSLYFSHWNLGFVWRKVLHYLIC